MYLLVHGPRDPINEMSFKVLVKSDIGGTEPNPKIRKICICSSASYPLQVPCAGFRHLPYAVSRSGVWLLHVKASVHQWLCLISTRIIFRIRTHGDIPTHPHLDSDVCIPPHEQIATDLFSLRTPA